MTFDMELYRKWYSNKRVLKSLVYQMKYREGAILSDRLNVRMMKIRELPHLLKNMETFNTMEKPVNWYYSLAVLRAMPVPSFDLVKRKAQSEYFNANFHHFVDGYDIGFDFDGKIHGADVALADMRRLHKWMQMKNIQHSVRTSSYTGFHINIFSRYMWQPPFRFRKSLVPYLCLFIGKALKHELTLTSLDTSIFDLRRIWNVPYSMDIKSGGICRVLNQYEIENFEQKFISPNYCLMVPNTFYRKSFDGTKTGMHRWLIEQFEGVCKNSMEIWRFLQKHKNKSFEMLQERRWPE